MRVPPTKEEIQHAVAKLMQAGLVSVRPPPVVTLETLKRRHLDNRRAKRSGALSSGCPTVGTQQNAVTRNEPPTQAPRGYQSKRKVYIPPIAHKYIPKPTKIHSPA